VGIYVGSVVINCEDIERMTQFWVNSLGLEPGPLTEEGRFRVLGGDRVNLSLQVAQSPIVGRNQVHLDLYTDDAAEQVQRLVGFGATVVRHNDDPQDTYTVMQDPEGNAFCVCS
jgi:predicted enzyme related to lactoylglutathione lyase